MVNNNITSPAVVTTATFVNAQVLPDTDIFQLNIIAPFVFTASSSASPAWPLVQILGNPTGSSSALSLRAYSESNSSVCSSFNSSQYSEPAPFQNGFTPAAMTSSLRSIVDSTKRLDFDTSTAIGLALFRSLGRMRQGLVTSVAYDGSNFNFSVRVNLTRAVQECGASRGVSLTYQSDGQTYALPISYVEHRPGSFSRSSIEYRIKFSLTGQVTIGATAQYRRAFYTTSASTERSDCPTGSARLLVNNTLLVRDVLDPAIFIAINASVPRFAANFGFAGVTNCYADSLAFTETLGCDRSAQTCAFNIGLLSQCRQLKDDGLAFSQCDRGPPAQREADVGPNNAYPVQLDGVHNVFVSLRSCPVGGGGGGGAACKPAELSPSGAPDLYSTVVKTSAYLAQSVAANPFSVAVGFLPTPNSPQSAFQLLSTAGSSSSSSSGQFGQVRQFDGNVGANQPATVAVLLPVALRTLYDLRLQLLNCSVVALDAEGRRLGFDSNGSPLPEYSAKTSALYREFANALLYTAKDEFDAGCGARQSCFLLPACENSIGCDGFSVPVQQLRNLLPGNGYGFSVTYRIGLTNADGSPPNARIDAGRQLLAAGQDGEQQTYEGSMFFALQVDGESVTLENSTNNDDDDDDILSIDSQASQAAGWVALTWFVLQCGTSLAARAAWRA